ncbi:hypothetical protein MtrunA17_Chr6g0464991 [Medicago truncatula]|uniref:Uncharacterized protein n=1 Tax=Medicago truncatula TaxID=3880 RepID=A0A072U8I3_MEDTR|nr:hypothetical protein MTR_6g038400 [Medicago truncatula]RHN51123.1 hypothetical protein MtrunA17_Chr6g0464991 [Medicago truncatula]
MLNFHNISLRPPWSIFIITQKSFSSQTKAIGKLTKLSKTFMFTPKANSKQKHVKKTQERETWYAVTRQLVRRVSLLAVASCDRKLYGNRPVSSQKPNFSSTQTPNLIGNLTYDYSTT